MAPFLSGKDQVTHIFPLHDHEDLDIKDSWDRIQLAAEGLERLAGMLCNREFAISRFSVCAHLGVELMILSGYVCNEFAELQGLEESSDIVERVELLLQDVENVLRVRPT
jgi:hypothetical protein